MPSNITNLKELQTFGIAALYRGLQAGGNLRRYCADYNAYKSPTGRRQQVRVPYMGAQGELDLVNPDLGLKANAATVTHRVIDWKKGASDVITSHPLAFSYDRWELSSTGLAVQTVNEHAARQVARYEQTFDTDVVEELKGSDAFGASDNRVSVSVGPTPTSAQVEDLVQAALAIPWVFWRRGMVRRPGGDAGDGSPQREIICVMNVSVMQAIINEYFDDVAVGRAINDAGWLQSTLGPMLGGMTLVLSHAFDDGITSARDEYAFGAFLAGSVGYVTDDSPQIDAQGYVGDNPTLEQRIGFFRDHGVKLLAVNEVSSVKMDVA